MHVWSYIGRVVWNFGLAGWVTSRVSLLISIRWLNLTLTYGVPPEFSRRVSIYVFKPPYGIGAVPRLSGHAIAYDGAHSESPPTKGQDSSKWMLPWQVIMDQLKYAFLFNTIRNGYYVESTDVAV